MSQDSYRRGWYNTYQNFIDDYTDLKDREDYLQGLRDRMDSKMLKYKTKTECKQYVNLRDVLWE